MAAWLPIYRNELLRYFDKLPLPQATLVAVVINITWLATLVWVAIRAWRRVRNCWLRLTGKGLFLLLCLVPLDSLRTEVFRTPASAVLAFLNRPLPAVGLLMLLAIVVWKRRWVVRCAAIAIGILSPLTLITLARIARLSLSLSFSSHSLADPPPPPLRVVHPGQPRVVWIIFDEADQRLVFEQRPANLQLSAFDRLRRDSLYATNAFPPGANTLESIPGLISGYRFSAADPKGSSDLNLTLADSGEVVAWTQLPSVFASAGELGFNTALVGWYHPYSRVLGRSLNYCAWYPWPAYELQRARTLGTAIRRQIPRMEVGPDFRRIYINTYCAMLADSLSVLTNASYGLLFLHLGPPHYPGIFNPATGQWTTVEMPLVTEYFNNLALADRTLGELRQALETSGQWDESWFILSADHNWRHSAHYDGRFDLRVPFLIKSPDILGI
jgi:hypothetical protein